MANETDPAGRRRFLGTSLGATTALLAGWRPAPASAVGANDRIRIGVIGTGGRARGLMTQLKRLPGNEIVAVCDVYEPRLLQAAEIAGPPRRRSPTTAASSTTGRSTRCVIGTPDHWHKTITLDAVAAGKDVYVEKPVSHTIAEGAEMVRVDRSVEADRADRHAAAQLGPLGARQADHRLGQARPDHVRPHLLVSARAPPATTRRSSMDKLDWKRWLGPAPDQPFRPERFYQWRHFWDFGGGCLTDLMTHWIDVVHWYMDVEAPLSAVDDRPQLQHQAVGSAGHRQRDARVPQELHGRLPRHLRQQVDDGGLEFRGDRGTLKIDRARLAFYRDDAAYVAGTHAPEPDIYVRSSGDGTLTHLQNWLDCIRSRKSAERAHPGRPSGGARPRTSPTRR